MRTITIGDHMNTLLGDPLTSGVLREVAGAWLDTDRRFTQWIDEVAKRKMAEEDMLLLVEAEEVAEKRAMDAWQAYVAGMQESEVKLIESLQAMVDFRVGSMGR